MPLEPAQADRTGVLLVNLGTPTAPTPQAVRRFLAEFLRDPRVVELPRALWLPLLHGLVLPLRSGKAAARYAAIWTDQGSPLMAWGRSLAERLSQLLAWRGPGVEVALAMRYGEPSIAAGMEELRALGCERIVVLPLYPQYSASTTATVVDSVAAWLARQRNQPAISTIKDFHRDDDYLDALASRVREAWAAQGRGKKLVLSFHGLPRRAIDRGDPYQAQCLATGALLGERLGLAKDRMEITFQSRFGAAEWLQPYTEPRLAELARQGVDEVDVFCPGFVADCIETLEEIDQQGRAAFLKAGGKTFRYIEALNDSDAWVEGLAGMIERHLGGSRPRESAGE